MRACCGNPQYCPFNPPLFSHCGNTLAHRWLSPPLRRVGRVGGEEEGVAADGTEGIANQPTRANALIDARGEDDGKREN